MRTVVLDDRLRSCRRSSTAAGSSDWVPDAAVVRDVGRRWFTTAALVVEILSPDYEMFAKFPFYAGHGIPEVLVVDPAPQVGERARVELHLRDPRRGGYSRGERSPLLGFAVRDLAAELGLG